MTNTVIVLLLGRLVSWWCDLAQLDELLELSNPLLWDGDLERLWLNLSTSGYIMVAVTHLVCRMLAEYCGLSAKVERKSEKVLLRSYFNVLSVLKMLVKIRYALCLIYHSLFVRPCYSPQLVMIPLPALRSTYTLRHACCPWLVITATRPRQQQRELSILRYPLFIFE